MTRFIEILLGFVFVISAFMKLYDFESTVQFINSITGLSIWVIKVGLFSLSFFEIIIGICFVSNRWRQQIIFYSILCLLCFFILISSYFLQQSYSNCGCFGTIIRIDPVITLFKNILILTFMLWAKRSSNKTELIMR